MAGTNKQLAAQLGLVLGVEPGQDAGFMGLVAVQICNVRDWWDRPAEAEIEEGLRKARKAAVEAVAEVLAATRPALKEIVESFAFESELGARAVNISVRKDDISVSAGSGPVAAFKVSLQADGWEVDGTQGRRFEALGEAWVAACAGYYGPRPSVVNGVANLLLDGLPLTG